jgi:hypothetical protein
MDYGHRTWNVRSLYRAGLSEYKLDLAGVKEVRWEGGGTEPAEEYTFCYRKGNENHELDTGFLNIGESFQ